MQPLILTYSQLCKGVSVKIVYEQDVSVIIQVGYIGNQIQINPALKVLLKVLRKYSVFTFFKLRINHWHLNFLSTSTYATTTICNGLNVLDMPLYKLIYFSCAITY